jgi:hypothetical protein
VAAEFSVTAQMVGKWRARFVAHRLAGLSDEDRPGEVSDRLCTRSTIS